MKTGDVATTICEFIDAKKVLITANPVFNKQGEMFRVIANVLLPVLPKMENQGFLRLGWGELYFSMKLVNFP